MKRVPYSEVAKELGSKLVWIKDIPKAYEHLTSNDVYFEGLLAEFLLKMHDKHPKFVFAPKWIAYASSESPMVNHVYVYFGKTTLGDVEVYGDMFTMRGDRIRDAKPRAGRLCTKDIKRAGVEFTKYFKPESPAEKSKKHMDTARVAIYNAEQVAKTKRGVATGVLDAFLLEHIMDNLETYAATAKSYGATDNTLNGAKLAFDEWRVLDSSIGEAHGGYFVYTTEGLYMVSERTYRATCDVYTSTDLPTHINDKLGQLKLVQNNTHIRNVGLRVDDNTFYVRGEKV
jgi:hypothetical protein